MSVGVIQKNYDNFIKNNFDSLDDNESNNNFKSLNDALYIIEKKTCCCIFSYCCKSNNNYSNDVKRIIKLIKLSPSKKIILFDRYVKLVDNYKKKSRSINNAYNILRFINQTGSILTPALLSIQYIYPDKNNINPIYWCTWIISLIVGLCTNYIVLFKLDKLFYTVNKTYLKLIREGWLYFELSEKYAKGKDDEYLPSHNNRFPIFCNEIEKIRKGEIDNRYIDTPNKLLSVQLNNMSPRQNLNYIQPLKSRS